MITERQPSCTGWSRAAVPHVLRVGNEHISSWKYGRILVISQLADMKMPQSEVVGPTWLVSVSRNGKRPSPAEIRKVRRSFGMHVAEIDNHHPGCAVNLFLPVDPQYRVTCECKDDEVTITEKDGYTWTTPKDGECRGCELEKMLGLARPCPIHSGDVPVTPEKQVEAKQRWYSKVPPEDDNGSACELTEHRTPEAAERAAAEVLADGSEGWPEDVSSIEWGLLVPIARAHAPLTSEIRKSGPLDDGERQLLGRLADETIGLIAAGTSPSMVDVEALARLAARAVKDCGVT